jgi:hypothetical protein
MAGGRYIYETFMSLLFVTNHLSAFSLDIRAITLIIAKCRLNSEFICISIFNTIINRFFYFTRSSSLVANIFNFSDNFMFLVLLFCSLYFFICFVQFHQYLDCYVVSFPPFPTKII